MIANYVKEQHDSWDQFLREFAYAICTAVNETTGKTPAELFLGRKLITAFQKLVRVSDGTEFAAGLYRVLEVKNNNLVVWKVGKRLTINVDQVRIYRHRKCDETKIKTGSSDSGSLRDESSGFDRVQRRSNESQDGKKKGLEVKRELEEKGLSFRNGEKRTNKTNKRGPLIVSIPSSWSEKEKNTQQGGPVRSRKGKGRYDSPYIEERTRSSNKNARRGGDQQRQDQERRGVCTKNSLSLEAVAALDHTWTSAKLGFTRPPFFPSHENVKLHKPIYI
ncbi:uncharacterized protein TNCV_2215011 [Trichonephila clavipes]|nr:uncharacterized protein TNCV_2215011 [Trichonephila clavipes]